MPARRRRYGGGYGRRRRQRTLRVAVGLLLVLVAAGGAYTLNQGDPKPGKKVATLKACPSPAPTRAPGPALVLPAANQVHLVVLNGTIRPGLAKTVADQLAAQGFVVTGQGNAPAALAGVPVVSFGTGGQPAGVLVSHWLPGSRLDGNPKLAPGSVQVVLGSSFTQIATPAQAAAAGQPTTVIGTPVPTPTGCGA